MSSKLMNKLKIGHSKSTNIIVDQTSKVSELSSPILKTSLSHHHQHSITTRSSEKPIFTIDEQSSGLSSPPLSVAKPASNYQSSFRENEINTKCAYLFRGDSLYNSKQPDPDPESLDNQVERVYVYDPFCPIHGSRRRMISRRTRIRDFDYHLTSIESVDDTEPSGVILLRNENLYFNFSIYKIYKISKK
ncbi:unnamed protein product [Brugia timori]|uniref:Uncharacterized protein n=2 Tax=Brugia TaxID=6278 RepID=A0A0R3QGS4_9BILA|nr:unnamed protein product [Brugia timori]